MTVFDVLSIEPICYQRPTSVGMSTPTPTPAAESRPSPWLATALTVAITSLGIAVQWGTLGSDVRHLERRANVTESELAWVAAIQASAAAQSARLDARLDGMERELARLARAVERLTDERAPAATARELR